MSPVSGVVLLYHEVLPDDIAIPSWTVVRESDFRRQMAYLGQRFDVVSIDQALERVCRPCISRKPFAVVTFDDGYRGNLSTALPVMESMGLPFVLYVASKAIIDGRINWYDRIINLLNSPGDITLSLKIQGKEEQFRIPRWGGENRRWIEVQRLLAMLKNVPSSEREKAVEQISREYDGVKSPLEMLTFADLQKLARSTCVTVGSHTHGHELLDQLDPKDLAATLHASNRHITRIVGYPPRHFAYPNGNFNQNVVEQVRSMGYETAVTTLNGTWSREVCRLKIPRIGIGRFETSNCFKARLSGYL
jgi:peptidoglycan/xylan/chitin deacetylase (PgdA/CDA1 family)